MPPPLYFDADRALVRKYGLNRRSGRFHVRPGFTLRAFTLNTSRPLFRDNPRLRRAVSFALDRGAFGAGNLGARLTDQLLPPSLPGFVDAKIYPLERPNLASARQLARGHLRGGKAVLYVGDNPLTLGIGQMLKRNWRRSDSTSRCAAYPARRINARLATPGEPFDMTFLVTPNVDYYDPYAFLNLLLESRFIGRTNWSNLRSAKWDRRLRAASRLRGSVAPACIRAARRGARARRRSDRRDGVPQRADARLEASRLSRCCVRQSIWRLPA